MMRQQGFAIVAAIFILVVLAALGASILGVSTNQQIGSALDVQGSRAYQAVRAGIEWGLYRQTQAGSCVGATSFSPGAATLSAFTVTVSCVAYPDGKNGPTVYAITAVACNQPNAAEPKCPAASPGGNYIERMFSATL